MTDQVVKVFREDGTVELPAYQSDGAAAMDIRANIEKVEYIYPGDIAKISTGLYVELPRGWEFQIRPRSGLATLKISVANSPGTIDCISGDTKIHLLDGKDIPIKDLVGQEFYVYSVTEEGFMKPGRAHSVVPKGKRKVVKITTDAGTSLVCTHDHEIRLWDGTYRKAISLTPGTSLSPLSRAYDKDGYELIKSIYRPQAGRSIRTNRMVAAEFNDIEGKVVHHMDENVRNNDPGNLCPLTHKEHYDIHPSKSNWHEWQFTEEGKRHLLDFGDRVAHNPTRMQKLHDKSIYGESRKKFGSRVVNHPNRAKAIASYGSTRCLTVVREVLSSGQKLTEETYEYARSRVRENEGWTKVYPWFRAVERFGSADNLIRDASNCKVVSVDHLEDEIEVYDMTVDSLHNFACNGMFVHNCDYRGEIKVLLKNDGNDTFKINPEERIAQIVLAPTYRCVWEEVSSKSHLSSTSRDAGGFGHTGRS